MPELRKVRPSYVLSNALLVVCAAIACSVYDDSLLSAAVASGGGGGHAAAAGYAAAPENKGGAGGLAGANQTTGGSAGNGSGAISGTGSGSGSGEAGARPSTGGTDAGGSASGGSSSMAGASNLELIDDMEDGNAFVRSAGARDGHWDVGYDATQSASQTPISGKFTMKALADEPQAGDKFCAYTKGKGFSSWGAFMTVSMRTWPDYAKTPTYDASAYVGMSFYAKVGASSDSLVRVRFISADTDPRGSHCSITGATDVACYDHFLSDVTLTNGWQRYDLKFKDFKQTGVGKQFPSIDLAHMYALEFFFPSQPDGNDFELWVDDLNFISN